jgi:7-cyano-7-deazaguanine synthase
MGGHDDAAVATLNSVNAEEGAGLAICLVSGGMDSCVTAAIAHQERDSVAFLHVSYGQRTEERERRAFEKIAGYYQVHHHLVVSMPHFELIGGSSLTDKDMAVAPVDLHSGNIPTSYVPFRNAHFLAVATSWAEVIGAGWIYMGAVAEDSSGYPDCRPEFYKAFQMAINTGTKLQSHIQIRTPVINLTKEQIVQRGQVLGAPLELTWSCYKESEVACGECDSCALRLRAFRLAGIEDPIPYMLDSKRFAY